MKKKIKRKIKPAGIECCPLLDPTLWQNKTFVWKNKLFFRDRVKTLFYIPLNIGRVMKRMSKRVKDARSSFADGMMLSDHTSMWNMDIYVAAKKRIAGMDHTTLSGKFFTRVYEGSHNETQEWAHDFDAYTKSKKMKVKKLYMWYTTCPKCSHKYGKNYVVFVAQID